jgi:hypothetical protein
MYTLFYHEISGFQINSVGVRFRGEKCTDIKLLFVNNLKGYVETFLIKFIAVTSKGNQKRLLLVCAYWLNLRGAWTLAVVAFTSPHEKAFYLSKCNSTPYNTGH